MLQALEGCEYIEKQFGCEKQTYKEGPDNALYLQQPQGLEQL